MGPSSKRVQQEYQRLLAELGPELAILLDLPLDALAASGGDKLAAGIGRMRRGEVNAIAGYDGEYGVIKLFDDDAADAAPQLALFADDPPIAAEPNPPRTRRPNSSLHPPNQQTDHPQKTPPASTQLTIDNSQFAIHNFNAAQRAAVLTTEADLIIVAGPGTGKTRTLTARIAYLIQEKGVAPGSHPRHHLHQQGRGRDGRASGRHGRGRRPPPASPSRPSTPSATMLLRAYAERLDLDPNFVILSDDDRLTLAKTAFPDLSARELNQLLDDISAHKNSPNSRIQPLTIRH